MFWHRGPTSRHPEDGQAIRMDAAAGESRAVLLIHGFTGTPFEMHLLARHLHAQGYHCQAPLLSGHHGDVAALARTRWPDWLKSAEDALLALHASVQSSAARPPRLAVVGLSMGGLLTLELGRRHPDKIQALCLLATPLSLKRHQTRAIRALCRTPLSRLHLPKLLGSDVSDREMSRRNPCTPGMPLAALGSLLDLMDHVRAHLGEVHHPALLAHGEQDHVVPASSMKEIAAGLGTPTPHRHVLSLPGSYHLLPLDREKDVLFDAISRHLLRYL